MPVPPRWFDPPPSGGQGGIDAGFASLLMLLTAVDAGLGACYFGIPAEPPRDVRDRRKPVGEVVHRGRWGRNYDR